VDSATAYRNESPSATGMLSGKIPRDQLFYTSKVPPKAVNYDDAKKSVDESLAKTGLEYIGTTPYPVLAGFNSWR